MSAGSTETGSSCDRSVTPGTIEMNSDCSLCDMPDSLRRNVCNILDRQDAWIHVAREMEFSNDDIDRIKITSRNVSPTEKLLNMWSDHNHTVTELFMILYTIQQYQAMECLLDVVDKRYHRLIYSGQPNITNLLQNQTASSKILNGPPKNMSNSNNNSYDDSSIMNSVSDMSSEFTVSKMHKLATQLPLIPYDELKTATSDWCHSNLLGRGGFGNVYRGKWKFTEVAIKRIEYRGTTADAKEAMKIEMQQILNEVKHLNCCRHDNILPLYAYSYGGKEPCLIYQLMAGGSLENRLSDKTNPLTQTQRLNISIGTARGLQFLHTFAKRPLIHGDIKPANILLDPCCIPKIGDFGLAREGSFESMEVSKAYGTRPFLPGEFLQERKLSTKVDTYSFGVVLFVLMTGQRAYDKSRGPGSEYLVDYVAKFIQNDLSSLKDKNIDSGLPEDEKNYEKIMRIGIWSTHKLAEHRPEMVQVMQELEK